MTSELISERSLTAAAADIRQAATESDHAQTWLARADPRRMPPLAAEVWVFDEELTHLLLIRHRWRGLVPPGGTVEPSETPREGAHRELFEETGLRLTLLPGVAAATVRSYRSGWAPTLGLAYTAVTSRSTPLNPEPGQPTVWTSLAEDWATAFPEDSARVRAYAAALASRPL
ncbi:NUDIX hydrolase [Kitasatospora sp. NPDC002227]|uniref:NUDIX hydrolase n=1 Tax=Kitasatospora sp. NPDC002227 TaxID=3154773 RepID=UPI0033268AAE